MGISLRWILASLLVSLPAAAEPPFETDVFVSGEGGYDFYRIPSLIVAPDGTVLVFCEGRKSSRSDDGDIDLLVRRSRDHGRSWLDPELVIEEGGDARIKFGNPTALLDRETGRIWVAINRDYLDEKSARQGGALVLIHSDDNGNTWSSPREITADIKKPEWKHYAFGPGIGIQLERGLHKGRLIIPANYRESFDKRKPSWSHLIYSDDHGESWKLGGQLGDFTNECQVVEILEDGKSGLLFNARNHWGRAGVPKKSGHRLVARSFDGGATWSSEQMDSALFDSPCQASLFRYSWPDGSEPGLVLFTHPAGPGRSNLTIRLSRNEGRSWTSEIKLCEGSSAYSCMGRLGDGTVAVIYERDNYGKLIFVSFDPGRLDEG